jgi:hypothetical protein
MAEEEHGDCWGRETLEARGGVEGESGVTATGRAKIWNVEGSAWGRVVIGGYGLLR